MSTNNIEGSFRGPGVVAYEHPGTGNVNFGSLNAFMTLGDAAIGDSITIRVADLDPSCAGMLILHAGDPNPAAEYFFAEGETPQGAIDGLEASYSKASHTFTDNADGTFTVSADVGGTGIGFVVLSFSDQYPLDGFANPQVLADANQYATKNGVELVGTAVGYDVNDGAYFVTYRGAAASTVDAAGTTLASFGNVITGTLVDSVSYDAPTDVLSVIANENTTKVSTASEATATSPNALDGNGNDATQWLRDNNRVRTFLRIDVPTGAGDVYVNFGAPADATPAAPLGILIEAGGSLEMTEVPGGAINIATETAARLQVTVGNV